MSGSKKFVLEKIEQHGKYDRCKTSAEVDTRFSQLDKLYEELLHGARFKTMKEQFPDNFREQGGIHVHIGREGALLFGGGGCHRLAIAQVLKLPLIPAQIGVIHRGALGGDVLQKIFSFD